MCLNKHFTFIVVLMCTLECLLGCLLQFLLGCWLESDRNRYKQTLLPTP